MNLGAFMNPEFPIFSTTLCYLERDDAYLMLHRIKKQELEWVPKDKAAELPIWEGDKIFFRLLNEERPYFSLKLVYEGDTLTQAVLDGKRIV